MRKKETLAAWKALPADQPIVKHFRPIGYKTSGSRYGACGIRIDGSPAFVDAVLSHLKEVLVCENGYTRLELSRSMVHKPDNAEIGKRFQNADEDAEVCYIRVHERGGQSLHIVAAHLGIATPEMQRTVDYDKALNA